MFVCVEGGVVFVCLYVYECVCVPNRALLSSQSLASYLERTELLPPAEAASLADVIQRYSDRFSSGQDVDETFQYLRSLGVRNLPDILKHYTFVVDMTKAQLQEKVEWIKQHRGLTELEIGHIISHAPRMLVKQVGQLLWFTLLTDLSMCLNRVDLIHPPPPPICLHAVCCAIPTLFLSRAGRGRLPRCGGIPASESKV